MKIQKYGLLEDKKRSFFNFFDDKFNLQDKFPGIIMSFCLIGIGLNTLDHHYQNSLKKEVHHENYKIAGYLTVGDVVGLDSKGKITFPTVKGANILLIFNKDEKLENIPHTIVLENEKGEQINIEDKHNLFEKLPIGTPMDVSYRENHKGERVYQDETPILTSNLKLPN